MRGPALLFCPADRADRYEKALAAADSVILDLEDAVAPADKAAARESLISHALDPERVIVRVNPVGTEDHALDMQTLAGTGYRTIMLAKTEGAAQLDSFDQGGYRVIALCETALGIARANEIAGHEVVAGMMWGAEDLAASMCGTGSRREAAPGEATGAYRDFARYARSRVLIEAKAAGKRAIDSVFINIGDLQGLQAEVTDAVASGFDATACIHPTQVSVIRSGYAPTAEQSQWAERLLAEAERQPGVFKFEGRMIDEPVLRQARAMLGR